MLPSAILYLLWAQDNTPEKLLSYSLHFNEPWIKVRKEAKAKKKKNALTVRSSASFFLFVIIVPVDVAIGVCRTEDAGVAMDAVWWAESLSWDRTILWVSCSHELAPRLTITSVYLHGSPALRYFYTAVFCWMVQSKLQSAIGAPSWFPCFSVVYECDSDVWQSLTV